MQVFQCFRWFFDCLQRPIRTAFETLPFIRYVCLLTGSQRELEHDGKRKTGSWKWESICRITFIDFKRNGAECIRLGDRQLTYAMQYSHLRVSFLNGIVYWSIDDDDDALLFQEPFFFFWKMLGSLETEKVWNARGSVWKLTKNLIYYWSGGCSAAPFIITFIGRIEHHPSQELPHSWLQWRQWFPPAHHSWSLFKQKVLFSLFFSSFFPQFPFFITGNLYVAQNKQTKNMSTDYWTWRRNRGSKMTRSILNILTGGLPSWTTLRPLLFSTWPLSVAFSFLDGARKAFTGPFNSFSTGIINCCVILDWVKIRIYKYLYSQIAGNQRRNAFQVPPAKAKQFTSRP